MGAPVPPKSSDPRFDDWIFKFWQQVGNTSSGTSLSSLTGQFKMAVTGSLTIAAGYGAYSPDTVEVSTNSTLEIGSGSTLEIG